MRQGDASKSVIDNFKRIRETRGMTHVEISGRTAVSGWPLALISLSRLENNKRRVDVDDLLALAAALDVAPSELMPALAEAEGAAAARLRRQLDEIRRVLEAS